MKEKAMTHTVVRVGDARTSHSRNRIRVRKTKRFYIADFGARYSHSGHGMGPWPAYSLDLATLKIINEQGTNNNEL